jgi:hypothetical protein
MIRGYGFGELIFGSAEMPRYIKNARGQLVGWTRDTNGIEYAYNHLGRLLGWYNRRTDHTHDSRGRLRTISGDATSALIFEDDPEE